MSRQGEPYTSHQKLGTKHMSPQSKTSMCMCSHHHNLVTQYCTFLRHVTPKHGLSTSEKCLTCVRRTPPARSPHRQPKRSGTRLPRRSTPGRAGYGYAVV